MTNLSLFCSLLIVVYVLQLGYGEAELYNGKPENDLPQQLKQLAGKNSEEQLMKRETRRLHPIPRRPHKNLSKVKNNPDITLKSSQVTKTGDLFTAVMWSSLHGWVNPTQFYNEICNGENKAQKIKRHSESQLSEESKQSSVGPTLLTKNILNHPLMLPKIVAADKYVPNKENAVKSVEDRSNIPSDSKLSPRVVKCFRNDGHVDYVAY